MGTHTTINSKNSPNMTNQRFSTLSDWLSWQETLHGKEIDLGLQRVDSVREALRVPQKLNSIVITIAGTNGKGSSLRLLEEICKAQGLSVGSYTSPHIEKYNERIKLNGEPVDDQMICEAFERIDVCRKDTSLSYFEFGTLAALEIFNNKKPDVVLLEVGLGGRLDAVNIIDPDIALITSIGMDHMDFLGDNLEDIAREKCGVMRQDVFAVCGERRDISSIKATAESVGAKLLKIGEHFEFEKLAEGWNWLDLKSSEVVPDLTTPFMNGEHQYQNAAAVLMATQLINKFYDINISKEAVNKALSSYYLPGRVEAIEKDGVKWVIDVSHNVDGVQRLADFISTEQCIGDTYAVFGLLKRKELEPIVSVMDNCIDKWMLTELSDHDSFTKGELLERVTPMVPSATIKAYAEFEQLYKDLLQQVKAGDRVVLFGSFRMVEAFNKLS